MLNMWSSVVSRVFSVDCGVRQGGVLSPYLFALYIDSIVDRVRNSRIGCYLNVSSVNKLLHICEQKLTKLDVA